MNRSVIIPAAGLATRMKPLSKGVSKAMIPVNGRPLISYVIEQIFQDADVNEVVIVENEIGDIYEFVTRVYPTLNIKCVVQEEKLGPLHAISVGHKEIENPKNAITVWLGDTICLNQMAYRQDFLAVHSVEDPHRWCLVDHSGQLYDKPETPVATDLALIGIYNFCNRKAFNKALAKGMSHPTHKGEYQIAALLTDYMKSEGPMDLVIADEWYDCGELNTYYESKARLLSKTARSFNNIEVDTFYGTVTKSSHDYDKQVKIDAERNWFDGLTEKQSLFCPRILDSQPGQLVMSMVPGTALNEVLVYDNLRTDIWHEIIRKILNIHHRVFESTNSLTADRDDADRHCFEHYYIKTRNRISEIEKCVDLTESEISFLTETSLLLSHGSRWSHVMHGDSHLGNIIYDPHSGSLKFVDPRGVFGRTWTQGDLRYDMGKLMQDFYCGYAMIMAKRYSMFGDSITIDWVPGTENLADFLENELAREGYDTTLIKRLSILLLLTAIPFHADDQERQRAMLLQGRALITSLQKNSTNK